MKQLIADLGHIRSGVVCDGLDRVTARLCQELPFIAHEFASGLQCNGWTVPQKWECQVATIKDVDGNLLYDGNAHPLGVCAYSNSFVAGLGGEELKKHLYYADEYDDALIYHTDWWYKPWKADWGFSVTKNFFNSLDDKAAYHVELRTTKEPGAMKVLEYTLPGETDETVILNAHNCHPGCANDDLSGCAVGIEIMRALMPLKRRLTYKLIIGPEHFGSIFYLDRFGTGNAIHGLFLESLGTQGPLKLQRSFPGLDDKGDYYHDIDLYVVVALKTSGVEWDTDAFRTIVGNDETCWQAAGINCASLSRVQFKEYHTSYDNAELMDEAKLQEAVAVVVDALHMMDVDKIFERTFNGLVCLSNPEIDLYKPMLDPSIPDRRTITPEQRAWNLMMDYLPQYFGKIKVLEIAARHELLFWDVYNYIQQWKEKGLVE